MAANRDRGKWYVIYDDGEESQPMPWDTANSYARMFKGVVKHIDEKEK